MTKVICYSLLILLLYRFYIYTCICIKSIKEKNSGITCYFSSYHLFGIYIRDAVRSNQIFKMEVLAKTVTGFKSLAIFAKGGIVDIGLVVTTHCINERFHLLKYKHYYFFLCIFKRL